MSQAERRHFSRQCHPRTAAITVGSGPCRTGLVGDISLNGCFVRMPDTPLVGSEIEFRLEVGVGIHGRGLVRRSVNANGVGIEFTLMSAPNFRRLQSFAHGSVPLHRDTESARVFAPIQSQGGHDSPVTTKVSDQTAPIEIVPAFLDSFHLSEQPFGVTPDPLYLYPSRTHCRALASLTSGILNSRGFLALIAEPGTGKTILLNELLDELHDSAATAFLFQAQRDGREFFSHVVGELGIEEAQQPRPGAMPDSLREILSEKTASRERLVILLDEAQDLNGPALEAMRLLSDFDRADQRWLQVILAGPPRLAKRLMLSGLAPLRNRLGALIHLQALRPEEVGDYIEHRLKVAEYRGEPLFAQQALAMIARLSQGIPRDINAICCKALSLAHERGLRTVTSQIVREAMTRRNFESIATPSTMEFTVNQIGKNKVTGRLSLRAEFGA